MSRRELPLADRLAALQEAVDAAYGSLPDGELDPARTVLTKAGARTALGDATVVALAGATGSGKSTLFNALAGSEISRPGVRRPTTGVAHASVWGGEDPDRLLDWLGVPRRHVIDRPDPSLNGLVLLDLPDHDSTRLENRLEVDRLVELVDVLVWVLDPQKYADAAVHDRYLKPLAGHSGVLMVVLNQADRLDEPARRACLADLRRLLDSEGLHAVPVRAVSATTGLGLAALRAELATRVAARKAASDRLAADVRRVADTLAGQCATGRGAGLARRTEGALVSALADAAGVPVVTSAVERSARAQATARTSWPPLRWLAKLRPDPLARLHVTGDERARTSIGPPSGLQQATVSTALRATRDAVGAELPQGWRDSLRRVLAEREAGLPAALDRAVAGTSLATPKPPRWSAAVGVLQWLLLLTALVGAGWLLGLVLLSSLQLDDVLPTPRVEGFPVPTLLLGAGLLAGVLVAAVARPFARMHGRRRARRARAQLLARVKQVAQTEVLAPLEREQHAHADFCRAVDRARSAGVAG